MNFLRPLRLIPIVSVLACPSLSAKVSQLWGAAGEKWTPGSRLPDFSFAGYRRGEEPFRIPAENISASDFGAKGDGRTDDTEAFNRALAVGGGKVINVPAGRYIFSKSFQIKTSNLVLRGAGPGQTVFVFTKSLDTLFPRPTKNDGGTPTSGWSWGGGLIMVGDSFRKTIEAKNLSARVIAPAQRGANRLRLEKPVFKAGDEVTLIVHDTGEKSLLKYLYQGQTGDISGLNNWQCRQIFRIRAVNGTEITLDRGLRFDVRGEWQPTLEPFRPEVADVGIENITFEFPALPYAGHFKEAGWNPVAIRPSAAHCWLKNLVIRNGDNGPFVEGAAFCTLENIRITADPQRRGKSGMCGHHGVTLEGYDILCTNFSVLTQFYHDITAQSALGCVFAGGKAINLSIDHHRWAPYENLFTDIDGGLGNRLFQSSGGGNRGMHTAAGATFWNIRAQTSVPRPKDLGPKAINFIGAPIRDSQITDDNGEWQENFLPGQLQPVDLHAAMLARRLAGK
ncbi:MAG: glycosyl hydrolase family 28-related protein [Verrucomicrobiota bacterium]